MNSILHTNLLLLLVLQQPSLRIVEKLTFEVLAVAFLPEGVVAATVVGDTGGEREVSFL